MESKKGEFSVLFKKFRLKSGFATLGEFGDALAQEGLVYEDSLFSHWQKGDRIPHDRKILLTIVKVFIKKGSLSTTDEINLFLASAGQGYLTENENKEIIGFFEKKIIVSENEQNILIEDIENSGNIPDYLMEQADLAYEKIYEGYPHMVYKNMGKLIELIFNLGLHKNNKIKKILSRINWVRARCLSDITKPKDFKAAYWQAIRNIEFAKETNISELGPSYWMATALKRLEIITRPWVEVSRKEAEDCLSIGELSLKYTSKNHFSERLVTHFELAKTALILKDKNYFDKQMEMAFDCVGQLPEQTKYLEIMAWDVQARGSLRLGNNTMDALKNIQMAKRIGKKKYRALYLFLQNTEYQALRNTKDPTLLMLAENLKEKMRLESLLLNNPYQKLRFRQKKFVGL